MHLFMSKKMRIVLIEEPKYLNPKLKITFLCLLMSCIILELHKGNFKSEKKNIYMHLQRATTLLKNFFKSSAIIMRFRISEINPSKVKPGLESTEIV